MKVKISTIIFLGQLFCFCSWAMDNYYEASSKDYQAIALAFFPKIHNEVATCAIHWTSNSVIPASERDAIEEGYLKHANIVLRDNYAPELKKQFQAMADYYGVKPSVLIKIFGCARWYTGPHHDINLFVQANLLLAQFTKPMVDKFYLNIDAIREGFAGDATTKEGKIININKHIEILESMRYLTSQGEAKLAQHHDAIVDYILFFKGDERQLALEFAILSAQSSLKIVKEYVPPSNLEVVGIVAVAIWNKVTNWF